MSALALIRAGQRQAAQRYLLSPGQWQALLAALPGAPGVELFGLWAEPGLGHAAFHQAGEGLLLASLAPEAAGVQQRPWRGGTAPAPE